MASGEEERKQNSFESAVSPLSTNVTGNGRHAGASFTSETSNNISFEEAVYKASKEVGTIEKVMSLYFISMMFSSTGVWRFGLT